MKVRILKRFKDKHTGEIYASGEEVDFSEERIQEILESQKLIELIDAVENTEEPGTEEPGTEEPETEEPKTEEPEAKSTAKRKSKKMVEEL